MCPLLLRWLAGEPPAAAGCAEHALGVPAGTVRASCCADERSESGRQRPQRPQARGGKRPGGAAGPTSAQGGQASGSGVTQTTRGDGRKCAEPQRCIAHFTLRRAGRTEAPPPRQPAYLQKRASHPGIYPMYHHAVCPTTTADCAAAHFFLPPTHTSGSCARATSRPAAREKILCLPPPLFFHYHEAIPSAA